MQSGRRGETYNVGGQSEMENIAIVRLICDILDEMRPMCDGNCRQQLITFVTDRPGHDHRYAIDFSKLNRELGWNPRESFATGLRRTIDWYLDNPGWIERIRSGAYSAWIDEQYGRS